MNPLLKKLSCYLFLGAIVSYASPALSVLEFSQDSDLEQRGPNFVPSPVLRITYDSSEPLTEETILQKFDEYREAHPFNPAEIKCLKFTYNMQPYPQERGNLYCVSISNVLGRVLPHVDAIDCSKNRLTISVVGNIPDFCGLFPNLKFLDMSENHLSFASSFSKGLRGFATLENSTNRSRRARLETLKMDSCNIDAPAFEKLFIEDTGIFKESTESLRQLGFDFNRNFGRISGESLSRLGFFNVDLNSDKALSLLCRTLPNLESLDLSHTDLGARGWQSPDPVHRFRGSLYLPGEGDQANWPASLRFVNIENTPLGDAGPIRQVLPEHPAVKDKPIAFINGRHTDVADSLAEEAFLLEQTRNTLLDAYGHLGLLTETNEQGVVTNPPALPVVATNSILIEDTDLRRRILATTNS